MVPAVGCHGSCSLRDRIRRKSGGLQSAASFLTDKRNIEWIDWNGNNREVTTVISCWIPRRVVNMLLTSPSASGRHRDSTSRFSRLELTPEASTRVLLRKLAGNKQPVYLGEKVAPYRLGPACDACLTWGVFFRAVNRECERGFPRRSIICQSVFRWQEWAEAVRTCSTLSACLDERDEKR